MWQNQFCHAAQKKKTKKQKNKKKRWGLSYDYSVRGRSDLVFGAVFKHVYASTLASAGTSGGIVQNTVQNKGDDFRKRWPPKALM